MLYTPSEHRLEKCRPPTITRSMMSSPGESLEYPKYASDDVSGPNRGEDLVYDFLSDVYSRRAHEPVLGIGIIKVWADAGYGAIWMCNECGKVWVAQWAGDMPRFQRILCTAFFNDDGDRYDRWEWDWIEASRVRGARRRLAVQNIRRSKISELESHSGNKMTFPGHKEENRK